MDRALKKMGSCVSTTPANSFFFSYRQSWQKQNVSWICADIHYSREVVQIFSPPSQGPQLQLNLSSTLQGVHSLMLNNALSILCTMSNRTPSANSKASINIKKGSTGDAVLTHWPCQMLARRMNFHLVAFELVQLLPYRRLRKQKQHQAWAQVCPPSKPKRGRSGGGAQIRGEHLLFGLRLYKLTWVFRKWKKKSESGPNWMQINAH